jgi:RHS repeat-associated protein
MDPGSGTLDMGARRFSPDTGGFLQADQFESAIGNLGLSADPLTANRYGLAGGNPVGFVEWDGHMPQRDVIGGGGADTDTANDITIEQSDDGGEIVYSTPSKGKATPPRPDPPAPKPKLAPEAQMEADEDRAEAQMRAQLDKTPPKCENNVGGAICAFGQGIIHSLGNPGETVDNLAYEFTHTGTLKRMVESSCKGKSAQYCGTSLALTFVGTKGVGGGFRAAARGGESAGGRAIVIGEDMEGRVIPTAKKLGADWYNPPDAPPAQWMENNRRWINERMDEGCTIFDCGAAPGRAKYPEPTSPYYQMELDEIAKRGYPTTRVGGH